MDRQSAHGGVAAPLSLESLIAPTALDAFVTGYLGQRPLHVRGRNGRFSMLFDWAGLERLLESHSFDEHRLRLVKQDQDIARDRYTRSLGRFDRIDGGALSLLLDSGATLVLNAIDDLVPAIGALADSIGDQLEARCHVNCYATCRAAPGFGPHWDSHDVLIVQLAGAKNWSVYRPPAANPLKNDPNVAPGDKLELECETLLEDGDILYLPRGWVHAPVPTGEASLHLTISISRATGAGFLEWLATELRADPLVRADLPFRAEGKAWEAWKSGLAALLGEAIVGGAAERYLADRDSRRSARPQISFADFGRAPAAEWSDQTVFRPASLHRIVSGSANDGGTALEALGRSWPCAPAVAAAIGRLRSTRPLSLGELREGLDEAKTSELRQLLAMLVTIGALSAGGS